MLAGGGAAVGSESDQGDNPRVQAGTAGTSQSQGASHVEFRVNLTVEVDQVGNALCIRTPVPLQLLHRKGRWLVEGDLLGFEELEFETFEEALVAGARQVGNELQASVIERPVIAGRIGPDVLPAGRF